jgi:cyanophycinase
VVHPDEAAEMAEAGRDLMQMARDIAAADKSPKALRDRMARRTRKTPHPDGDDA